MSRGWWSDATGELRTNVSPPGTDGRLAVVPMIRTPLGTKDTIQPPPPLHARRDYIAVPGAVQRTPASHVTHGGSKQGLSSLDT